MNGKFLGESGNCPQTTYSIQSKQIEKNSHQRFTKQMIEGRVLQTQMHGSDLTVKFLPSSFQSYDGDILFHFSTNVEDENEILSYKLIDGKILYYYLPNLETVIQNLNLKCNKNNKLNCKIIYN